MGTHKREVGSIRTWRREREGGSDSNKKNQFSVTARVVHLLRGSRGSSTLCKEATDGKVLLACLPSSTSASDRDATVSSLDQRSFDGAQLFVVDNL